MSIVEKITYALFLLVLCMPRQATCASSHYIEHLKQLEPIIFAKDENHADSLYNVFYLSDDEIWYNFLTYHEGNGKLLSFDLNGTLIEKLNIHLNGTDPSILCINHIDDRLIVGCRDDSTGRGEVIVLNNQRNEVTRIDFSPEVYTIQMVASKRGILFSGGIWNENDLPVFLLSEIDAAGEVVFEYRESVARLRGDAGSTQICSNGESHYAIIENNTEDSLMREARLVRFNANGKKIWEINIPSTTSIHDMAVLNGHIYLIGTEGERDEYGCLFNQTGVIFCYDISSTLLWHQTCSSVENLYIAIPSKQGCYAISILESQALLFFTDENGIVQKTTWFSFPENETMTFFALTDFEQLIATGTTMDSLYIDFCVK